MIESLVWVQLVKPAKSAADATNSSGGAVVESEEHDAMNIEEAPNRALNTIDRNIIVTSR